MTRTDIHRPSAPEFDPEKYDLYGVWDMSPEYPDPIGVQMRLAVVNGLLGKGYRSGAGSSHQCGHCGTHIRYAALMVRDDVREYIYVGETCLDERFESLTAAQFKHLRETARLNRERATKRERIAELIAQHPALVWATYPESLVSEFTGSIARQFTDHGRLSDRQIECFTTAIVRDTERNDRAVARETARLAKVAAGVQVPTGKTTVTGTVLHAKFHEDSYSGDMVPKMIVESTDGWKVWVTIPTTIRAEDGLIPAGTRVEFVATVTPKHEDPTFGFAKRPSKARVLTAA
jgi:hypothetical protein